MARVVITMYNGIFEGVIADQEGVEVLILEQDKYADEESTILVDGNRVIDHHWDAEYDPVAARNLCENVEQARKALAI
ncbi:MAG: hypothetical protein QME78_00225 [Thermodesulfobacteriota bacterium]|nr:hypothetical protein [Thermodesulfobacteriota bacterium]